VPKRLSGPEHLDAAHDCFEDLTKARASGDWPKVAALAAEAQAHLSMALLVWQLSSAPGPLLAGRQGQRWLNSTGVEQPR